MTREQLPFRATLLGVMVGIVTAFAGPSYREVCPEPSAAKDPFYYVDYEKSPAHRAWLEKEMVWPWFVGLATGVPVGIIYFRVRILCFRPN